MDFGVFDVATNSADEQRMVKQAANDKIAAATYDVRERHGEWLFGATDIDGFHDRAKLAYVSICQTIEPHVHARTGVYRRVLKNLEQEWRQRQACYPGCHEDEAHAKKFHKDKDGDEKEARRRQAGPAVHEDPDRAHRVLDRAHEVADEHGQRHHDIIDRAHQKVDERSQYGNGAPRNIHAPGYDPNLDTGWQDGGLGGYDRSMDPNSGLDEGDPYAGDPIHDLMGTPLGQHFQEEGPSFGRPVSDEQHWARNRYAEFEDQPDHPELHNSVTFRDHQGEELKPAGDFDAYKDGVDQGAPSKVDHEFVHGGGQVREHNESGDHNFVPTVTGSREYQLIARMVHGTGDPSASPAAPAMPGGPTPDSSTGGMAPVQLPTGAGAMGATPPAPPAGSGTPVAPMTPTASREYQIISAMAKGNAWALKAIQESGTRQARKRLLEVVAKHGLITPIDHKRISAALSNKTADRNYLQQADEALTKVLNEKAEEFQNTIAPLQQALITIQQAEQLANPLNVSPPAGTVNVLPQGAAGNQPAAPGQMPQLGADPAAAGLAGQPAAPGQLQARKRGGHPKGRGAKAPTRRADIVEDFSNFEKKQPGLPTGGEADIDKFTQQKRVGPRAVQKLKQQQGISAPSVSGRSSAPGGASNYGIKAKTLKAQRPLIAEPDYIWSKSPSSVHIEFANRIGSGAHPNDAYRQMLAEIHDHYRTGQIDNRDAHRAANEAFGRLLFSKKHLAETYHGEGDVEKKSGPFAGPNGSFPVGTPKDLADAKSVCNNPSVRGKHPGTCDKVEHMQKPARRKQAEGDPWTDTVPQVYSDEELLPWNQNSVAYQDRPEGHALYHREPRPERIQEYREKADWRMPEHLLPSKERMSSRKQAWSGWGPEQKPKRHVVAGWDWDDHLNGFLSTAHRTFQCSCGEPVKVPDYHNCKCGKIWNTYVIGTGGDRHQATTEKFLAREVPVRKDVLVANKRLAGKKTAVCEDCAGAAKQLAIENLYDKMLTEGMDHATAQQRAFDPEVHGPEAAYYMEDPEMLGHAQHERDRMAKRYHAELVDFPPAPAPTRRRTEAPRRTTRPKKTRPVKQAEVVEVTDEFPSDHHPARDTKMKGTKAKDWHSRDTGTQQWVK